MRRQKPYQESTHRARLFAFNPEETCKKLRKEIKAANSLWRQASAKYEAEGLEGSEALYDESFLQYQACAALFSIEVFPNIASFNKNQAGELFHTLRICGDVYFDMDEYKGSQELYHLSLYLTEATEIQNSIALKDVANIHYNIGLAESYGCSDAYLPGKHFIKAVMIYRQIDPSSTELNETAERFIASIKQKNSLELPEFFTEEVFLHVVRDVLSEEQLEQVNELALESPLLCSLRLTEEQAEKIQALLVVSGGNANNGERVLAIEGQVVDVHGFPVVSGEKANDGEHAPVFMKDITDPPPPLFSDLMMMKVEAYEATRREMYEGPFSANSP